MHDSHCYMHNMHMHMHMHMHAWKASTWKVAELSDTRKLVCRKIAAAPPTMAPCTAPTVGTRSVLKPTKPLIDSRRSRTKAANDEICFEA